MVPPFWIHSTIEGFVGFTSILNARSVRPMRESARTTCFVPSSPMFTWRSMLSTLATSFAAVAARWVSSTTPYAIGNACAVCPPLSYTPSPL